MPKDARHTAASLPISADANVKAVHPHIRHKSVTMTLGTYADLFDDDLDAVAQRLHDAAAVAREETADQLRTSEPNAESFIGRAGAAGQ